MPIRPPALDDRGYDDLVADLLARIPAHAPEYTHPRPGDPGRTLVELLAWLADTILYRANLIPERQRLAFLRLLGLPMRPAIAARGIVRIVSVDEVPSAVPLPPLTRLAGPVPFETTGELTVLPVTASAYLKRRLSDDERKAMSGVVEDLKGLYGLGAKEKAEPYITTAAFAAGAMDPAGVDLVSATVDGCLWLALLAEAGKAPLARGVLASRPDGQPPAINVGYAPLIRVPALFEGVGPRAAIGHVWELTHVDPATGDVQYRALDRIADTTSGLTRAGVLRLALTGLDSVGAPTNDVRKALKAGVGELPPRIDDPALAARLVAWLRLRPTFALQSLAVSWVGVNAVEIDQRETTLNKVVGAGDGGADQQLPLPAASVEPSSFVLEVDEPRLGWRRWRPVDDLALAGPDDAAYRLDSEAGTVTFGDRLNGRALAAGQRVRVAMMRAGGGLGGNLRPGSLTALAGGAGGGAKLSVAQDLPTTGGDDAETLDQAERRIPAALRHRDRAVTAEDFRAIAAETPGVRLGRVDVLPRFKPQQRRPDVPGVVSVMVLPDRDGFLPPYPRPDRPLLEAVFGRLDARRPLTTELYVIGCEYVPIGVSLAVTVADGFGSDAVLQAVRQELRRTLWPLPPGGPRGEGYPRGRAVRDRELEVVAARVPGVDEVAPVRLFEAEGDAWRAVGTGPGPSEVALEDWQLPELLAVVVVADSESPSDLLGAPAPGGGAAGGIAVPVVPEVC